ncbi:MAG: divergent polysaccharide deacetylase family protein [Hyphomonas sp.]|uniref:divergent polysaccharide deacetylase family protein n=1 Tax=Hyphomonas sp. TaxID=87 RepID=UPI0034A0234D
MARLETTLARTSGYFGIVNYQGAKFAADKASASPVLARLSDKGLAFIDDGSFDRSVLSSIAREAGLRYARAYGPIDNRQTPADISAALMDLEAEALEKGAAFGSGYAFPVTVEAAKVWISQLEEKGLLLAPVSAITNARPLEVRTGSLDMSGLNTGG